MTRPLHIGTVRSSCVAQMLRVTGHATDKRQPLQDTRKVTKCGRPNKDAVNSATSTALQALAVEPSKSIGSPTRVQLPPQSRALPPIAKGRSPSSANVAQEVYRRAVMLSVF